MITSRRWFLRGVAPGCPLSFAAIGAPATSRSPADRAQKQGTTLDRAAIEAEMRRRAAKYLNERRLVVDYYRIRRRLAFPLPLEQLVLPSIPVPTISDYPWAFWLLWELEERINALGWAAEWFKEAGLARCASRDIRALADWPKYYQYAQPDLTAGHAGRILWAASTKWTWVSSELREKIRAGCARHVEQVLPQSDAYYGPIRSKQDFLAVPQPHLKLHNIPLIGTVGAALAANAAGHPAAAVLNARLRAVVGALLDLRSNGYTEGVGYDGYVLDFVADWLGTLSVEHRKEILEQPSLNSYLEVSYGLSAPGAMQQIAELGDVEPKEMPYHYSAQAKLAQWLQDPVRTWYLKSWPADWIRADALGVLRPMLDSRRGAPPKPGALRAQYAAVLRTGWEDEDVAVAMSCTSAQTGHLPLDSGTIVVGSRGRWIISDPGYQQYMDDQEREFTIGSAAHNYPVINGLTQERRHPRLISLESVAPGFLCVKTELAECYPQSAHLKSAIRSVWLDRRACVVVADEVQADHIEKLTYHWHAHPDAALWVQQGWALLHFAHFDLWVTSPLAPLSDANIVRLPGSRGQLTLSTEMGSPQSPVWWIFAIGDAPPRFELLPGGRAVQVAGKRFEV